MFELVLDVFDVQNQTPTNFFRVKKTIRPYIFVSKKLTRVLERILSDCFQYEYIYIYVIVSNYKQLRNIFLRAV